MSTELRKLEGFERALVEVRTPAEAKDLGDKATALKDFYLKGKKDLRAANKCAQAAIMAYRKAGEILLPQERRGGDRKSKFQEENFDSEGVGLSKKQSHCYQSLARVPGDMLDKLFSRDPVKHDKVVSVSEVYGIYRKLTKEEMRLDAIEDGAEKPKQGRDFKLLAGDCEEAAASIPNGSVDVIITDPPYLKEHLDCYVKLAAVASRVLKPGGSLFTMAGQSYLPQVMQSLAGELTYCWTLCYSMPGGHATRIWTQDVNSYWKPILWYAKGEASLGWQTDVIKNKGNADVEDKDLHDWGQNLGGMLDLVEKVSKPGEMILDPFMGSGTTLVAALKRGRKCIGIDVDKKHVNVTAGRIKKAWEKNETASES